MLFQQLTFVEGRNRLRVFQQAFVRPFFQDLTVVQDQDVIGIPYRAYAMGR